MRFLTAGESHGKALIGIIEGLPAGLSVASKSIDNELARRQKGFGRGGRMKIETDRVQILSGVRHGKSLGSPVSFLIENKDWKNWTDIMSTDTGPKILDSKLQIVSRPRPGHADLAGALKYDHHDIRNVLERSSARETAVRVAIGAIAKQLLLEFDIHVMSYVTEIGDIKSQESGVSQGKEKYLHKLFNNAEKSEVRCPDIAVEKKIIARIKETMKQGNTLGGVFEVAITGVPAGLGSYTQWDRKLEARLAYAMMGIQAIKGVEIGLGFGAARKPGSAVMDEIFYQTPHQSGGFYRKTNNAGGIEGGMSNGMPIIIRAAMKPIPTLKRSLASVDINTKKKFQAAYERSDTCAVPAASVIGEAVAATVMADAFLDKFGGDSIKEIKRNYKGYLKQIREF
ncbi:MAG: chorismate synthase [Nitrospiraceae bacterium]|nr:MAG: chorismate synthase [Nitrospiraceae bacterium]